MKGVILAGGTGSRLRPLTYTRAKQLIPVANKPILYYGVEALRDAGIHHIGVVVGDTEAEIRAALGDGGAMGVRITYLPQEAPLGLAHAVGLAEGFVGGSPFVVFLGDNLVRGGIADLKESFTDLMRSGIQAMVLLCPVEKPECFGVAELSGDRLVRLVEKPRVPPSNLALVGIYFLTPAIFPYIRSLKPSWRGELEITDAIQGLLQGGQAVEARVIRGWWKDTGQPEDILEANRMVLEEMEDRRGAAAVDSFLDGRINLAEGAQITRSTIRGPVIVGAGARIADSYVGPYTAVGEGSVIRECEIENSIVMEGAVLEQVPQRIDGSLIGPHTQISGSQTRPRSIRLVLGERTRVILGGSG